MGLWNDGHARGIDLDPLDRAATAELLSATIGGPTATGLEMETWRLTGGNPLHVNELVATARVAGTLIERAGVWISVGPLPASQRLADLIDARLARLDPEDRAAVEFIAVGEPLPLVLARRELGDDRLQCLERRRLLAADHGDGVVRAVHPMYGEVLRAARPRTRLAVVAARLAELFDELEGADPGEADCGGRGRCRTGPATAGARARRRSRRT